MDLDPVGTTVAGNALIVVLLFALMYALAGSRVGRLAGIRVDAPFLFNPTGVRAISVVVGYVAVLVGVWGLGYAVVAPLADTTVLPVQAGSAAAGGVLLLTGARFARLVTFLVGGRTAVEAALSPDQIVPVDEIGDDVDLAAAVAATRTGSWQPAAALLGATGDADVRADRLRQLAMAAQHDSQWVEEWFAATPGDPAATAVRAELALHRAWTARGADLAERTSGSQFQAFSTGLAQAQRLAERAIELAPADPVPWLTLVEMARGQGVDQEEFQRRVAGMFGRAPGLTQGAHAVLQTVCAKWMGDTELMFATARELAAEAPAGSATCLLPLMAHVEQYLALVTGPAGPAGAARHMESGATRTELRACVQRWTQGADGPRPGGRLYGHNLAAYAFWLAEDAEAARPHLVAIGRSVTEYPWAYSADDEPGEVLGVVRRWAGLPVVAPAAGAVTPG